MYELLIFLFVVILLTYFLLSLDKSKNDSDLKTGKKKRKKKVRFNEYVEVRLFDHRDKATNYIKLPNEY